MGDANFAAKFGEGPPQFSTPTVLATQFAASALALCAIQPPFVLTFHEDERGRPHGASLNLGTVALVSVAAVATTLCVASNGSTFSGQGVKLDCTPG